MTERKQQLKCKHCGKTRLSKWHHQPWLPRRSDRHDFEPAEPKPARLKVEVSPASGLAGGSIWYVSAVLLDGITLRTFAGDTEPEARAAAEAYVAELLEHFRGGGT